MAGRILRDWCNREGRLWKGKEAQMKTVFQNLHFLSDIFEPLLVLNMQCRDSISCSNYSFLVVTSCRASALTTIAICRPITSANKDLDAKFGLIKKNPGYTYLEA